MSNLIPDNIRYSTIKTVKTLPVDVFLENFYDFEFTSRKCSKCSMYGKRWSCPSFDEDMSSYWKRFCTIELIHLKVILDEDLINERFSEKQIYTILHNTLFRQKKLLISKLEEDNRDYLSTGYCNICKQCSKENNLSCRFPDMKKYSIESVGGLVTKISSQLFDSPIRWIDMENGILPEYLTLVMAVLY